MQHLFMSWMQVAASLLKAFSKYVANSLTGKEQELLPLRGYSLAMNTACWRPQPLPETSCQREKSRSICADGSCQSVVSLFPTLRIIPTTETFHPTKKPCPYSKVALYRVLFKRTNSSQNTSGKGSHSKGDWLERWHKKLHSLEDEACVC